MTAIPDSARPSPLVALHRSLPLVDQKTGFQTQITQQTLEAWRNYILGMGRIVPCSATMDSNVITLTPNDASPSLEGYRFGDCYPFWGPDTSTGAVTATVVPKTGALATLKIYKRSGATQATTGDIVASHLYVPFYLPIADSNAGGLVLVGAGEPQVGSFTLAAAATKVVSDVRVTATSKINLTAINAAAGTLMGSVKSLYVSALSAGVSFTVATANAASAAGTETFDYNIVG